MVLDYAVCSVLEQAVGEGAGWRRSSPVNPKVEVMPTGDSPPFRPLPVNQPGQLNRAVRIHKRHRGSFACTPLNLNSAGEGKIMRKGIAFFIIKVELRSEKDKGLDVPQIVYLLPPYNGFLSP